MAYAEKRGKSWRVRWQLPTRRPDGRYEEGSESGFRTKRAALTYGNTQEAAIRAGTWVDPERGKITLDAYWAEWIAVQKVSSSTIKRYRSYYKNHLSPRWGGEPIASIDVLQVDGFRKDLLEIKHLAAGTVDPVLSLLGRMLGDAEFDRRIDHSPVRPKDRRRGERVEKDEDEDETGQVITLAQLLAICSRMTSREALMVLATAFTGMRWGEAAGMRRSFLFVQPAADGTPACGWYQIDKKIGALKEEDGALFFGPPKGRRARTIELPAFLVELLLAYLETVPAGQDMLFPTSTGEGFRRSNFRRQHWRPACDGWAEVTATRGRRAREAAPAVAEGLRFHDLRHTHETWLSEEHVEKIARDRRLGHKTQGIEGVYNHVTPTMRRHILDSLEGRWSSASAMSHPWS